MPYFLKIIAALAIFAANCVSQTSEWKIKPEWVHAHEAFLAGDAMRGRESATPDEWIAATYVASEFEKYGLKPGLPDGTYIQRVDLEQPKIQGKALLAVPQQSGFTPLEQGKDFLLVRSQGQSASGPLQKIDASNVKDALVNSGAIVLLAANVSREQRSAFFGRTMQKGVSAFLRVDPTLTAERMQMAPSENGIAPRVPGVTKSGMGGQFTLLAITKESADRLDKLSDGATVAFQIQTTTTKRYSYNAIGVLPGADSSATAKVVLLSAHLDHLGIGQPVNGDALYNGANDDASGTTAVIELAHALAAGAAPRRTVYFICYGSEELGGLGSTYFREHSPVALDRIAANLEFEMIGNQDPKMSKGKLLLTGWDRSNLGPTLVQHGALLGDDPYPEQRFFERSDNYPLALKGVVAHTAAGWGTPLTYHRPDDDLAHLDLSFMTEAIQSFIEPVRWLANSDFVPQWLPGKQPRER